MTIMELSEGVGGRRVLRLARVWTGTDVRAAALLRRADVIVDCAGPLIAGKGLRDARLDFSLPQDMLLALDPYDTLHLVGMGGFWLARPRETLRRWPAGTATVVVGAGRGIFRALTITDSRDTVTVAAPFMGAAQKEALALIARLTA
jgi:hypothetical protein